MRIREAARITGITVAAAAALGIAGCGKQPDDKPSPDVIATKTPSPIEQSKERYTESLERAKRWQSNAELVRVHRKFSGTLAPSSPTPLMYAFSSLADPKSTFEVVYQGDDVSERTTKKQPFELLFNPINVAQWKVAPDDALRLAEEAGGEAFREQHLAGYTLLQQLSKVGAHPLQWFFQYDAGDGTKARLEIYVNAETEAIDFKKQSKRP
ncbi:MAG TPA: hypothetical protein VIF43_02270 [Patescibacteria group bacterium]|jgi:hypothetical protein